MLRLRGRKRCSCLCHLETWGLCVRAAVTGQWLSLQACLWGCLVVSHRLTSDYGPPKPVVCPAGRRAFLVGHQELLQVRPPCCWCMRAWRARLRGARSFSHHRAPGCTQGTTVSTVPAATARRTRGAGGAPSPGSDPTGDPTGVGACTGGGSLRPAAVTASFFETSLFQIQLF